MWWLFRFIWYNKFKYRKWNKLSYEQRLEVFQKLEEIQAQELRRPVCAVLARDMDENMKGKFVADRETIYINSMFLTQYELRFDGMFTLFHEGRHAFQYYSCFRDDISKFSRAYKWRKNFYGYINGGVDEYAFYAMQPVERDANKYALNRLKEFKYRFLDDSYYNATVRYEQLCFDDDKFKAKEQLGFFYKRKIAKRSQQEYENNDYYEN